MLPSARQSNNKMCGRFSNSSKCSMKDTTTQSCHVFSSLLFSCLSLIVDFDWLLKCMTILHQFFKRNGTPIITNMFVPIFHSVKKAHQMLAKWNIFHLIGCVRSLGCIVSVFQSKILLPRTINISSLKHIHTNILRMLSQSCELPEEKKIFTTNLKTIWHDVCVLEVLWTT